MTKLTVVRERTSSTYSGDVIFVHGLDGDLHQTWTDQSGFLWPRALGDDLTSTTVWSIGYDAWSTRWRGHAMPLQDRAVNVLASLRSAGIGKRPICFVGHSMGGLIIKQLLFHAMALTDEYTPIASSTVGVTFIATPHDGSRHATVADRLRLAYRSTIAVRDLVDNSAYLRLLGNWYRDKVMEMAVRTQVFFETQPFRGVLVVDQGSANPGLPGVTPIPVDANHVNVARMSSRDDIRYTEVRRFVEHCFSNSESETSGRKLNSAHTHDPAEADSAAHVLRLQVYSELSSAVAFWRDWLEKTQFAKAQDPPPPLEQMPDLCARLALFAPASVDALVNALLCSLKEAEGKAQLVAKLLKDESLSPDVQERRWGTTFTREMRAVDKAARKAKDLMSELRILLRAEAASDPR